MSIQVFCPFNIMNIFSGQSPKATEVKAKINLIKLTSFCIAKETKKKTKRQKKKKKKNWAEDLNTYLSKEDI